MSDYYAHLDNKEGESKDAIGSNNSELNKNQ